ncbi:MAG: response regulator [Chloroflexota bacterium]|nr:response regulator [Chloroflexota bacterium]
MSVKRSILIVDDDDAVCETLSDILETLGYRTVVAGDGDEAVACVQEDDFGIVLMDLRMPGMNGVQTYREITKRRPAMEAIMMTAYATSDLVQDALLAGAHAVLPKPLAMDRLLNLLAAVYP